MHFFPPHHITTTTIHPCTMPSTHARPSLPVIPDTNPAPPNQHPAELHDTAAVHPDLGRESNLGPPEWSTGGLKNACNSFETVPNPLCKFRRLIYFIFKQTTMKKNIYIFSKQQPFLLGRNRYLTL